MKRRHIIAVALAFFGVCGLTGIAESVASDIGPELAIIKANTAKYHQVAVAEADGYVPFPYPRCNPGGGVFYLNYAAAFDGELKLEQPDGLGYMPLPNGKLQLVAVFFLKLIGDPEEPPPVFLGQELFRNTDSGIWEMKVWAWAHNPDGLFAPYNPRFIDHCDYWEAPISMLVENAAQGTISDIGPDLAVIRQNTSKYHCPEEALADGYTPFPVAGNPGGIDALYVKVAAAYDGSPETGGIPGVLKLEQPEGLGYVKLPNGELRLASVFFFKPYAAWPAPGTTVEPAEDPPVWLGHEPVANVGIGMWEMEAWVWVHNPDGMFEFYNPRFETDWDAK